MGYYTSFGSQVNRGFLIRFIISGLLLFIVISRVDFSILLNVLYHTHLGVFGFLLLLLFIDRNLMALKWHLLTLVKGMSLSRWRSIKIYLISNFFGVFLPTGVGGDIYRVYYTSKDVGQTEEIAASVVLERFIGAIASAIFAVFGFALMLRFSPQPLFHRSTIVVVVGLLIFLIIAFLLSIYKFTLIKMRMLFRKWEESWFFKKWFQLHEAYIEYRRYKLVLLAFFFLSVSEQALVAIANYFGARALDLNIELIYFIGVIPICQILYRIPISINGIGVQEGLYTIFFSRLGMSVTEAFSLAFLVRIAHWLVVLPGGILYLTDSARPGEASEQPVEQ